MNNKLFPFPDNFFLSIVSIPIFKISRLPQSTNDLLIVATTYYKKKDFQDFQTINNTENVLLKVAKT